MEDYLKRRPMPFHLWVRKMAYERLATLRRDYRRRAKRSVDREAAFPDRSSLLLLRSLASKRPSPGDLLGTLRYMSPNKPSPNASPSTTAPVSTPSASRSTSSSR